jgi:hypothetical protein
MLYSRLIAALFLLVVSVDSGADALPMPSPNPRGDLGLIIVASDSPEYIHEWLTTPPGHGVTIKRLHVAKPEQLIVSSFLVHGVTPDQTGNYFFNVSFYVLNPDGKPLFGVQDFAKGEGKIPINPSFIMADPALDIVLEESDPPGIYTIVAQVVDITSGKKADASYKIKLIKNRL